MKTPLTKAASRPRRAVGFSLMELMVVIVIIAVLAVASMFAFRAMREKSWAASSSMRLRQCAVAIQNHVADKGRYPEAWDFGGGSGGGAWSWQIREYVGYTPDTNWPLDIFLHPRHGVSGIRESGARNKESLHHFAASAILLQDVDESKTNQSKNYIRPWEVSSPVTTIMLGDAPLKTAEDALSGCHAAWWPLRFNAIKGNPDQPIDESTLRECVDFWMNGKAHFLFADGHIEVLAPNQVLRRYFQL